LKAIETIANLKISTQSTHRPSPVTTLDEMV